MKWATYFKDLKTGWYNLKNTSIDKRGKTVFARDRSQETGWTCRSGWKKWVEGAGRSRQCYDRLRRSRLDKTKCLYFDDVHTVVIMNNLFMVETPGSLDHDIHAG